MMPSPPRAHQQSSVDEHVFNRDMDFSSSARPITPKFDPSYSTMAVSRLTRHPFRGVPAFMTDEPRYGRGSMPRSAADHMKLNRIQINQGVVGYDGPDNHAFLTGKIGKAPFEGGIHPAHFTALSSVSRIPRAAPPPNEMALARACLPAARYGPAGSRQPPSSARGNPFGPMPGTNRYFGRLGSVRTQLV